jgi:hypothetical protein
VVELTRAGEAELAEQDRRANDVAEGLLGTLAEGQRRELVAALGTAQRLLCLAAVSMQVTDPRRPTPAAAWPPTLPSCESGSQRGSTKQTGEIRHMWVAAG